MLRIGVDARPLNHPFSGIGQYTKKILEQICNQEDVQIFLYSRDSVSFPGCDIKVRHSEHSVIPNALFSQLVFPLWIKKDNLDVFWSPRHHLPLMTRCPSVVTIHDMVWLKCPETMTRGGAFLERILMPASIRKAHQVVCVSHATLTDVALFEPSARDKCVVIPEAPATTPSAHPIPPSTYPYFLFVGTREPRKNLNRCLQAWKSSQLAALGFKLILAGRNGWKFDLNETVSSLGLEESVIEKSPTADELPELYANCFAVVLPSLYEGFGLPLVEGMAFGKPLITSNVSSMPEIAGDAALLVNPLDIEQIGEAFTSLVSDELLYKKLSDNAKKRATLYSWSESARKTLDTLRSSAALRSI